MPRQVIRNFDSAISLDGTVNADVTTASLANSDFSIAFWAKKNQLNTINCVLGIGSSGATDNSIHLTLETNKVGFNFYADDFSAIGGSSDLSWHHYIFTFSASTKQKSVYQDRTLIGQTTSAGNFIGNTFMRIGAYAFTGSAFMKGSIAEILVYNRLLSSSEMDSIYYSGLIPASPVNYYKLNEGVGTIASDIGSTGSNANFGAGVVWSKDVPMKDRQVVRNFGASLIFNGSSSKVSTGTISTTNTDNWTLAAWAKPSPIQAQEAYIMYLGVDGTGGYGFGLAANSSGGAGRNLVVLFGQVTRVVTGYTFTDLNWHHIITTRISGTVNVYVDGALVYSGTPSAPLTPTSGLGVGYEPGSAGGADGRWFTGNIDNVRIYNSGFTGAQARQLYTRGSTNISPLLWWNFDEGAGNTALDSGSSSNNGTIVNAQYTSDSFMKPRLLLKKYPPSVDFSSASVQATTNTRPWDLSTNQTGAYALRFKLLRKNGSNYTMFYPGANRLDVNYEAGSDKVFVYYYLSDNSQAVLFKTSSSMLDGNWHSMVVNKKSTSTDVWLDGVRVASQAITLLLHDNSSATFSAGNGPCDLHNICMWNRALTDSECLTFCYGSPAPTNGLVTQWRLADGAGTIAYDNSGNNYNGNYNGTPKFVYDGISDTRNPVNQNLIYNGDFSLVPQVNVLQNNGNNFLDGTATGTSSSNSPFGWQADGASTASGMFDRSVYHTPPASLKGSITVAGNHFFSRSNYATGFFPAKQGFTLRPNTSYTLTFWMKTQVYSGNAQGAGIQIMRSDYFGNNASEGGYYVNTTADWTQYTTSFTTSALQTLGHIEPRVVGDSGGTGNLLMDAWFDDIVLVPTAAIARQAVT